MIPVTSAAGGKAYIWDPDTWIRILGSGYWGPDPWIGTPGGPNPKMIAIQRKAGIMPANLTRCTLAATLAVAASLPAMAGDDYWDRLQKLQELQRSEAQGGPRIVGGRSPFLLRFRVCQVLPTPVRNPNTGEKVYVQKNVCWFE